MIAVDVDDEHDVITIEGLQFTGSFFRTMADQGPSFHWLKIARNEDGSMSLVGVRPDVSDMFDAILHVHQQWQ